MDTLVTITVFSSSAGRARRAMDAAFKAIERVRALADRHRPQSEVSKLMAARGPVRVSPELYRLLAAAKRMSLESAGAFDVTVGPLLELWKRCAQADRLPTRQELAQTRRLVGADQIELKDGFVRLARPGVCIDLGGIAKGYAVDAAIAALRRAGVKSALVNAGGDMAMIGPRPGRDGWTIGVQDPRRPRDPRALVCTLRLPPCAVATSGDYERYSRIAGRRFSHIVDPRTGWPCDQTPSVTIVSKTDAMTADMWATAASVLSPEESLKRIDARPDLEALLITKGPDDKLRLHLSRGFASLVREWRSARPGASMRSTVGAAARGDRR